MLCLIAPSLNAQYSPADSPSYHQSITVGQDGNPSLQFTNDSELPIFAFVMVEFPSLGVEGRTYYDFYVNQRELPIAPGSSITRGLSSFQGSEAKVRAEVRAVVFQDGTSDGDPVWVNAILAQRLRLYDRLRSVHELLEKQVNTGISREGILQMLQAAQADAEKQTPDDDLKPVDSTVFHGAISTFDKNRKAPVAVVLERYVAYLRLRIAQLGRSRPAVDAIRALPINTPRPLSESDLPADLRAAAAELSTNSAAAPGAGLSYCTVLGANFNFPDTQLDSCTDSEGNGSLGYINSRYTSFSNQYFSHYNASTGKTTDMRWSWSPGPNDLDMAWGQCVGFYDCDGNWDVFYTGEAAATGYGAANRYNLNPTKVTQGQNSAAFYWQFDNYPTPSFSDCDACDPYPNNEYSPVSANAPKTGVMFYFGYSCTVTP